MSRAHLPSLATVVLVLALPAPALGGRVVGWGVGGAPPPFHFVSVAAGGGHSLAVTEDGTVLAWGWNDDGQATVPHLVRPRAVDHLERLPSEVLCAFADEAARRTTSQREGGSP